MKTYTPEEKLKMMELWLREHSALQIREHLELRETFRANGSEDQWTVFVVGNNVKPTGQGLDFAYSGGDTAEAALEEGLGYIQTWIAGGAASWQEMEMQLALRGKL